MMKNKDCLNFLFKGSPETTSNKESDGNPQDTWDFVLQVNSYKWKQGSLGQQRFTKHAN